MKTTESEEYVKEYEAWFDKYPAVFESEVDAFRNMLPTGKDVTGIEVGLGTGKLSVALGLLEGVEPSHSMREIAFGRGLDVMDATATALPYGDHRFDYVMINFFNQRFTTLYIPFREAFRVLKNEGALVIGFIDRNSPIGQYYSEHKEDSDFSNSIQAYPVYQVLFELIEAGFRQMEINQTLFHKLDEIIEPEKVKPGFGKGSFVIIKASKNKKRLIRQ